jgi:hypothetical protein
LVLVVLGVDNLVLKLQFHYISVHKNWKVRQKGYQKKKRESFGAVIFRTHERQMSMLMNLFQ